MAQKNKNDILFAVDYFQGSWFNANIVYFKDGATSPTGYQVAENPTGNQNVENHIYGGAGMLPYLDGNTEYIISGRARYHGYETDPKVQKMNEENDGRIHMYPLESTKVSATARNNYSLNVPTRAIVNDMAMDHAHNLYAVSFTDETNEVGSGRIVAIALPYDGETVTAAPNSEQKFQFNPVTLSDRDSDVNNKCKGQQCSVYLNRPMRANMYNTICLPFDLDVKKLATNHPYYNATILAFDGVTISTSNNESVLELNFVSTDGVIEKNKPYLIKINSQDDITDEVPFENVTLQRVEAFNHEQYRDTKNDITYLGVIGKVTLKLDDPDEIVLILVNDNRLAQLSSGGDLLGFRGIFYFDKSVIPAGTVVKIAEREDTTTGLLDAQGQTVDVNKFLQEGRVYIRVGESLYTLDGQKVE